MIQSKKAFPYASILKAIFVLLVMFQFYRFNVDFDIENIEWKIPLALFAVELSFLVFALFIFPDTVTATLHEDSIEIKLRGKSQIIPLSQISDVEFVSNTRTHLHWLFIIYTDFLSIFYRVKFRSKTMFGKQVYIATTEANIGKSTLDFGEYLRFKVRNANLK